MESLAPLVISVNRLCDNIEKIDGDTSLWSALLIDPSEDMLCKAKEKRAV
jgi:hypothetical protein